MPTDGIYYLHLAKDVSEIEFDLNRTYNISGYDVNINWKRSKDFDYYLRKFVW